MEHQEDEEGHDKGHDEGCHHKLVRDWSSNDKVVEWCDDKVWVLSDNMMEIVGDDNKNLFDKGRE